MDPLKNIGVGARIEIEVVGWDGVEAQSHRFGGREFLLGKREIGHLQGDYLVDIPFPKKVRDEIIAAGQAEPIHILPQSGWVSRFLRVDEDVETAILLLRRSYEMAVQQKSRK